MYAKWALAPSGYYIGVIVFNNKHYYSHGRTVDHLEKNLKWTMYQKERVSATQVHLEQQRSEEIDLQYATKLFMTKYVKAKPNAQPIIVNKTLMEAPKPPVEYICEEKDGEMIIYEMKEIQRYKLHKTPWEPQIIKGVNDDND